MTSLYRLVIFCEYPINESISFSYRLLLAQLLLSALPVEASGTVVPAFYCFGGFQIIFHDVGRVQSWEGMTVAENL